MKTVTIKEDFRLPGTDVILEKGDKISIKEKIGSLMDEVGILDPDVEIYMELSDDRGAKTHRMKVNNRLVDDFVKWAAHNLF